MVLLLWGLLACGAITASPDPNETRPSPSAASAPSVSAQAPAGAPARPAAPSVSPAARAGAPADPAVGPPVPVPVPVPAAPVDPAPADPAPARVRPPKTAPIAPSGPVLSSAPAALYACEAHADCVISCDVPGGCCLGQCGCRNAVNRHVLAKLKEQPWAPCDGRQCPAVGCAYQPAMGAQCDAGRCKALTGGPGGVPGGW